MLSTIGFFDPNIRVPPLVCHDQVDNVNGGMLRVCRGVRVDVGAGREEGIQDQAPWEP